MTKSRSSHTQRNAILAHLQSGRPITPVEALSQYGCFRLAAVVHELRREGHAIRTDTRTHNGKRFAEYVYEDLW